MLIYGSTQIRLLKVTRKNIPKKIQFAVWCRNHWACRYCGAPVFFSPALKLLDKISPGHGYYHRNGKENEMVDLFQWTWASIDHIVPFSKGGEDEEANFVTACWRCNLKKGNSLCKEAKIEPNKVNLSAQLANWDGFSSLYLLLADKIDKEDEWAKIIKRHINLSNGLTPGQSES